MDNSVSEKVVKQEVELHDYHVVFQVDSGWAGRFEGVVATKLIGMAAQIRMPALNANAKHIVRRPLNSPANSVTNLGVVSPGHIPIGGTDRGFAKCAAEADEIHRSRVNRPDVHIGECYATGRVNEKRATRIAEPGSRGSRPICFHFASCSKVDVSLLITKRDLRDDTMISKSRPGGCRCPLKIAFHTDDEMTELILGADLATARPRILGT